MEKTESQNSNKPYILHPAGVGILVSSSATVSLISTLSIFSLPVVVPIIAIFAVVIALVCGGDESRENIRHGGTRGAYGTIICSVGMLAYLKVSILSKTALLFTLTSIGIFFGALMVIGGISAGLYMLCAKEGKPQEKEKN